MIFDYSQAYNPAAPVLDVSLLSSAEGLRAGPFSALVDSGADGTLVPVHWLDEIHAPVTVEMTVRSQWGERRRVLMYLVDIQIGDLVLPGIEVVGEDRSDEILLGRDVLNRLRMTLDGPRRTTEVD